MDENNNVEQNKAYSAILKRLIENAKARQEGRTINHKEYKAYFSNLWGKLKAEVCNSPLLMTKGSLDALKYLLGIPKK